MDKVDAASRSRNMAAIRRRDTRIEKHLRSGLWRAGLRGYRVDAAKVPGRPDVAFGRQKVAVFVDGCFWHQCPECYREPKSNTDYWRAKLERNVARDRAVDECLQKAGWVVLRVWEHEVERDLDACVERVSCAVREL